MKKFDVANWNRKETFAWFNSFSNPCYGVNVRLDVTNLVQACRTRGESFFAALSYVVCRTLNGLESFRLRVMDGELWDTECANPCYTVSLDDGNFVNCRTKMRGEYAAFCAGMRADIDAAKKNAHNVEGSYNNVKVVDDFYLSCVPWMDFTACTQPIPDNMPESSSIPRVCWGKYSEENGRLQLTMNITASHALVDGRDMSRAFERIQKDIDEWEK